MQRHLVKVKYYLRGKNMAGKDEITTYIYLYIYIYIHIYTYRKDTNIPDTFHTHWMFTSIISYKDYWRTSEGLNEL